MTTNGPTRISSRFQKALGVALGVASMVIGILYGISLLGQDLTFAESFRMVFPLLFVFCGGWLVGDILLGKKR